MHLHGARALVLGKIDLAVEDQKVIDYLPQTIKQKILYKIWSWSRMRFVRRPRAVILPSRICLIECLSVLSPRSVARGADQTLHWRGRKTGEAP